MHIANSLAKTTKWISCFLIGTYGFRCEYVNPWLASKSHYNFVSIHKTGKCDLLPRKLIV